MNELKHIIINFPAASFAFSKQKSKEYFLIVVGENMPKVELKKALVTFDNTRNAQELTLFFQEKKVLSIGLIKQKAISNFSKELQLIQQKINLNTSHFLVLPSYEDPNIYCPPNDLPVEECFLISPKEFAHFCQEEISTGLAYHLILKVITKEGVLEQIAVHQIGHPNPVFSDKKKDFAAAEILLPHNESANGLENLETALWYLQQQKTEAKKVSVCFDEQVGNPHFELADKHSTAIFFTNLPVSVGPYASQDILARSSEEEVLIFHNSEDISTTDRVAILSDSLQDENWDAVGSHELRINKIEKKIESVRFPLDVTGAKFKLGRDVIFFPTTAIKKAAFLKVGGLSTVRKHGSGSQFYWRAHFLLNIKNVDDFLYIRNKNADSAVIKMAQERLDAQWSLDFHRIQHRNINLADSNLVDEANALQVKLISLGKENRKMILDWQKLQESIDKKSILTNDSKAIFPNESDVIQDRILNYKNIKDLTVTQLKASFSWRIGWAITRGIEILFGWIPFVKKRL
jgi:hypothetical protein